MKVKSQSEIAQLCPILSDPMDCSLPGSSVHGIFQARVLEWGAIAFSVNSSKAYYIYLELVYLVTALVPSDTACLARSPGSSKRTVVWISLDVKPNVKHIFFSPAGDG